MTNDQVREAFEFLDVLRASSVTNMFGARPYLQDEFDIQRKTAGRVLSAWMETFDGETPADERAANSGLVKI